MEREIGRLDGHYILCGMGRVGRSVARELARQPVPLGIPENAETKRQRYASANWLVVAGDAPQEPTRRPAQSERAGGLIAATKADATNLCIRRITALVQNAQLKIIARASEDAAKKHLLTAGTDSPVTPYSFAGQRIAPSLLRPNIVTFLDPATTHRAIDLEVGETHITPDSAFAGKAIESSPIRQERTVIVLALKRREGMRFNPAPDERIETDDGLIAMGEAVQSRQLEQTVSSPS